MTPSIVTTNFSLNEEINIVGVPLEETMGATINAHARRSPEQTAIVSARVGNVSYRTLTEQISRLHHVFRSAGIGSNSRIGLVLPSGVESAVATIAASTHATCVPFHPDISQEEFLRESKRFRLDGVVVPEWCETAAAKAAQDDSSALFAVAKADGAFDQFDVRCLRARAGSIMSFSEPTRRSEALVLRTSATTGPSKLVPVTHGNMIEQTYKMRRWIGISASDCAACLLPTYYAQGCQTGILIPLLLGGSVAIPESGRLDWHGHWLTDLAPTWFSAGPTFLLNLLDGLHARGDAKLHHALRFILSSSAHLPRQVREGIESALGVPVLEYYGLSEGGMMAANPPPPQRRKPGTAGRVPQGELEIRDEAGNVAKPGEAGQIFIRGASVIPGYIVDEGQAREGLKDGWLATGDIGAIDAEGFLTIQGRLKELINRGGEKISPLEIERAALFHPDVREAAAFGVPHPRLGENAALAVVVKPEAAVTARELRSFMRRRLPAFKTPQRIDIVDSLPKGQTGKVSRKTLTELALRSERPHAAPEAVLEIQIAAIWRRLLKTEQIGIDDDFFEAGGDSLLAEEMLLEVESIVNFKIPASEVSEAFTIRGLAGFAIAASESTGDEPLVKVRDAPGTPFFFCHGDYGSRGFYALDLTRLIDPPQPFYLIHTPRDVDENSDLSIASMARAYAPLLLAAWPEGPFRLGGHCNGGLLAFEIANQLIRAGREVEFVLTIESISINCRWPLRLAKQAFKVAALGASTEFGRRLARDGMLCVWEIIQAFAEEADRNHAIRRAWGAVRHLRDGDQKKRSLLESRDFAYQRAMANYVPPRLDCEVVAITAEKPIFGSYMISPFLAPSSWKSRVKCVREARVPGDHLGCITVEVAALANCIGSVLRTQVATRGPSAEV